MWARLLALQAQIQGVFQPLAPVAAAFVTQLYQPIDLTGGTPSRHAAAGIGETDFALKVGQKGCLPVGGAATPRQGICCALGFQGTAEIT